MVLLDGRVAVVTCAGQGIDAAIARGLRSPGAQVVVSDINGDADMSVATDIGGTEVARDATDEQQMRHLVAATARDHGRRELFVNSASMTPDASLQEVTGADFDKAITVHLHAAWPGVREASGVKPGQKTGSIVNISSLFGKSGNPGQTDRSAAKAWIVGLTKAAAKELAHHHVRVNAVHPSLTSTPMTAAAMPPEVLAE